MSEMSRLQLKIVKDLRKSNWQLLNSTEFFLMQENLAWRGNLSAYLYRIVSRSFPQYRIFESNEYEKIEGMWHFIHEELFIPPSMGKVTTRKILKVLRKTDIPDFLLKSHDEEPHSDPETHPEGLVSLTDSDDDERAAFFEGDVELTPVLGPDHAESSKKKVEPIDLEDKEGDLRPGLARRKAGPIVKDDSVLDWTPTNPLSESPGLSFQRTLTNDGMTDPDGNSDTQEEEAWLRWFDDLTKWSLGLWDDLRLNDWNVIEVAKVYYLALAGPEDTTKPNTLQAIRERHFVKRRRMVMLVFTIYAFFLRFCSFDFFLFIVLASNVGLLYLQKNSGRINMEMAKTSVKNRVFWAKQYLGGLMSRKNKNMENRRDVERTPEVGEDNSGVSTKDAKNSNKDLTKMQKKGLLSSFSYRSKKLKPIEETSAAKSQRTLTQSLSVNDALQTHETTVKADITRQASLKIVPDPISTSSSPSAALFSGSPVAMRRVRSASTPASPVKDSVNGLQLTTDSLLMNTLASVRIMTEDTPLTQSPGGSLHSTPLLTRANSEIATPPPVTTVQRKKTNTGLQFFRKKSQRDTSDELKES